MRERTSFLKLCFRVKRCHLLDRWRASPSDGHTVNKMTLEGPRVCPPSASKRSRLGREVKAGRGPAPPSSLGEPSCPGQETPGGRQSKPSGVRGPAPRPPANRPSRLRLAEYQQQRRQGSVFSLQA